MAKTVTVRVINNRMRFSCSACGAKRNLPVQTNLRRKNIRCHQCSAVTQCLLNRRIIPRELQSGKAVMTTDDGKELDVNIHDISTGCGIGVDIPISAARAHTVKIGDKVRFRCSWNNRLLGGGLFRVVNSNGQRIGVKKIVVSAS